MILLTGASGTVGRALLSRLLAERRPVRCLVRDPREIGPERVRVQLVLGDLGAPSSFRHAMRGVDCVVHFAAAIRDAPRASIEELNGLATLRLARAAEQAGIRRFVLLSTLGASQHAAARFLRARALAEEAVHAADVDATILAPSLVVAPRDRLIKAIERLSRLPVVPVYGEGQARWQPIAADDVAACAIGALDRGELDRFELAGPDSVSYDALVAAVLRARRYRRRRLHVPVPLFRPTLGLVERVLGPAAPATPDEADLLELSQTTSRGTADAERLGVQPAPLEVALTRAVG